MSDELETPAAPDAESSTPVVEPTTERTYSAADYRAVQNEAKNLRARLREIEAQAAERANAVTTVQAELETIRTAHAAAAEELRTHRLRLAVTEATRKDESLRGLDPDLILPHLRVEWDDGKPKGVGAALKDVIERFPQLAAPVAPRVPAQAAAGKSNGVSLDPLIAAKRQQYPNL